MLQLITPISHQQGQELSKYNYAVLQQTENIDSAGNRSHACHRSPPTELLADIDDGVEALGAEVDATVEVPQIRQLHAQHLVHRRERERRLGVDAVLVQRGLRAQQPLVLLRPEERVVRPVVTLCERRQTIIRHTGHKTCGTVAAVDAKHAAAMR